MRTVLPALCACLLAGPAFGQTPVSRPVASDTSSRQALATLRKSVRDLVLAEEIFFSDHQRYTTDLGALWAAASRDLQKPDSDVSLAVTHAGNRAWRGVATHRLLPGTSCVVYVGPIADFPMPSTTRSGLVPGTDEEGVPVCDSVYTSTSGGRMSDPNYDPRDETESRPQVTFDLAAASDPAIPECTELFARFKRLGQPYHDMMLFGRRAVIRFDWDTPRTTVDEVAHWLESDAAVIHVRRFYGAAEREH